MKINETQKTVTTLDVSVQFARNSLGGSPLQIRAVVATVERGTFVSGRPNDDVRAAHAAVLAMLGWAGHDEEVTRGIKTIVCLASVDQVSRVANTSGDKPSA